MWNLQRKRSNERKQIIAFFLNFFYNENGDNMKHGFTLVELLAIITLLSLLFLLIYPKVIDIADKKEIEIDSSKQELINNAALDFMNENVNDYPEEIGEEYCLSLETLDNESLIPVDISDIKKQYNYVKIKIGVNSNHSYDLMKSDINLTKNCEKAS